MFHTQFSSHQWEQQGRGVKIGREGYSQFSLLPVLHCLWSVRRSQRRRGSNAHLIECHLGVHVINVHPSLRPLQFFLSLYLINSYDKYILNQEVTISVTIWPRARFSSLAVLGQWKENSPHQFISCLVIS